MTASVPDAAPAAQHTPGAPGAASPADVSDTRRGGIWGRARARARRWIGPKRVVAGWWLLLALVTLVLVIDPDFDVTIRHYAISFTLETVNALVATMVAFVGFARYVFERRPFDAAIAIAFGAIAITGLIFGLILPFSGYTPLDLGDSPIYGWMLTRLIAGVLLLVGIGRVSPGQAGLGRASRWLIGTLAGVTLLDLAFWFGHAHLPELLRPRAWAILTQQAGDIDKVILPGQTPLCIVFELGLAALYFLVAIRLSRAVTTVGDAWLALSLITAATAEFQFVFYPAPFHPAVTTADVLWLISYLLLLAYLAHQYLSVAGAMRQQQERTSSLLALSQTVVANRDPALVLDAARHATQAVAAEVSVSVVLDGESTDGGFRAEQHYPIAADGTHYGWLVVRPAGEQAPAQDTVEYLRIVANQTASLLRAIDLYDELSDSAVQDERTQLARELHDGLAQDLAVLRLRLGAARDAADARLVERALAEARYVITILRGQTAAPADFLRAMERQAEDLSDRFGCPVEVEQTAPLSGVPAAAQVALLRIAREAVINAGKHAAPSRIAIAVGGRDGGIKLSIQDDGRGFDPSVPPPEDRFGLRGMRERAEALGGALEITSRPGAGTTVRVSLPPVESVERMDGAATR